MIQISKMRLYWIITVFVLFLLKPLISFAEGSDPFDNTIVTFDDNIQTSDPLLPGTSIANREISSESNAPAALDQPVNTR